MPALTLDHLRAIMPNLKPILAAKYLPMLRRAMAEAGIITPLRMAAFLAQLAHESGQLRYFQELASGDAYEGRVDLGNTQPGDGRRYKGRGPIQLTGRKNYRKYGALLGVDLEDEPERVAEPELGFRVAAMYWKTNGLNIIADQCDDDKGAFDRITRRINGGLNGAKDRRSFYARACQTLGITT